MCSSAPDSSCPSSVTVTFRSTGARTPCSDRHPSSADLGLAASRRDRRIDDREHVVLGALEHEHALEDPDLRRGQPHAAGVVHELAHARGESHQIVVEGRDLPRAHPQDRVAVLPDLRERELTPRLGLGVEILVLDDLALDLRLVLLVRHGGQCS